MSTSTSTEPAGVPAPAELLSPVEAAIAFAIREAARLKRDEPTAGDPTPPPAR